MTSLRRKNDPQPLVLLDTHYSGYGLSQLLAQCTDTNVDDNTFQKEDKTKAFTGLKNNIDVSTSIRFEHFPATRQEIFRPSGRKQG